MILFNICYMNYDVTCKLTYTMTEDNNNYNQDRNPNLFNNLAMKITSFFAYWMKNFTFYNFE